MVGVIPNNQDTELLSYEKRDEFWQIVKHWQNNNWTVAMHGYTHVYDSETRKKIISSMEENQNFLDTHFKNNYRD